MKSQSLRNILFLILILFYLFAGVNHFINPSFYLHIIPPYFLKAEDFSDGLALVYVQLVDGSRKYGYIGR